MNEVLTQKAKQAIKTERELVACFENMLEFSKNQKTKAILNDLILMEEMNEVLLRSLQQYSL